MFGLATASEYAVNLAVIKQFLNHPLSEEQRNLLNGLIVQSEFIEVVGNTAVIAQADAKNFTGGRTLTVSTRPNSLGQSSQPQQAGRWSQ
ncbi:hypothetical protein KFU94_25565 [Chloroflexi bacterium TSY]|nr:hypothetical protein [Chloroflexi bacterium TSY]